jgi:anti-anti-sigma factor
MNSPKYFAVHLDDTTLIVATTGPVSNLAGHDGHPELEHVLAVVQGNQCRNVLVDLGKASFFGSVLLGALNTIWKQVRQRNGKLVLCSLSDLGREVIHAARFDTLWEIYPTREEALKALAR